MSTLAARRGLLGAVAAFTVAPVVTPALSAVSPDAPLIAACDRYLVARAEDRRCLAYAWDRDRAGDKAAMEAADAAWDAACDVTDAELDTVVKTPAITLRGAIQKARVIHDYRLSLRGPADDLNYDDKAVDALIADLVALESRA